MKKKIVVYGGSFNPPHDSHFFIAQQLLNQFDEVDKIIFVPVNKKYAKDGLAENKHRYQMLKSVIDKNDKFLLSDIDMKESRSLSTIETLELIQEQYPNQEICFLMGSDNLKEFHSWIRAEELIASFRLFVMERDEDNLKEIINEDKLLRSYQENIIKLDIRIKTNFSATYLRSQLKKGKSIRYLVPEEVYDYIEKNNLYKE